MVDPRGTDFNPEAEQLAEAIEGLRQQSEAVATDIVPFIQTVGMLEAHETTQLATEVPDDFDFYTNTEFDVLQWGFIGAKTLKRLGGDIVIVGRDGDRDKRICSETQVAEYAKGPIRRVITSMIGDKPAEFALLTADTIAGHIPTGAYALDPSNSSSWVNDERLAEFRDTCLFERNFMTGVLRGLVYQFRNREWLDSIGLGGDRFTSLRIQESLDMYQKLAEDDVSPLGPEELYGLMATAITTHMDKHPELDVRPKSSKSDSDEFDLDI